MDVRTKGKSAAVFNLKFSQTKLVLHVLFTLWKCKVSTRTSCFCTTGCFTYSYVETWTVLRVCSSCSTHFCAVILPVEHHPLMMKLSRNNNSHVKQRGTMKPQKGCWCVHVFTSDSNRLQCLWLDQKSQIVLMFWID